MRNSKAGIIEPMVSKLLEKMSKNVFRTSWNTFARVPARGQEKYGSTVQLYKSSQDPCQPLRHCLVVSDACLVGSVGVCSMSGGVNVYRLISPELMHVSEAADALVLLMQRALLLLKMN